MKQVPSRIFGAQGRVLVGRYRGGLSSVRLTGKSTDRGLIEKLGRAMKEKRWHYCCIATQDLFFSCAVVDAGLAGNAFFCLVDLHSGKVLAEQSHLGVPRLNLEVNERPGEGALARFQKPGVFIELSRSKKSREYRLLVNSDALELRAKLGGESDQQRDPVAVIAKPALDRVTYTQKANLLSTQGEARLGGRFLSLDGGMAGLDFTYGQPPRVTEWKWGFALGRTDSGLPVGFNLAQGNHLGDTCENVAWIGTELLTLPEVVSENDPRELMKSWSVRSEDGTVALSFEPRGIHREERNLVVVKSQFAQVFGLYSGRLQTPSGESVELSGVPGVAEDQRVKW